MTRRRLGILVRERDARGHLVGGRQRAHVFVLGERNRHVRLLARHGRTAGVHQRVGQGEGAGRGVGTQLANGIEGPNRLVQTSHAQQQRAELVVHRGERRHARGRSPAGRECRPSISSVR